MPFRGSRSSRRTAPRRRPCAQPRSCWSTRLGRWVAPVGYLAAGAGVITIAGAALVWLDGLAMWAVGPAAIALGSIPVYVLVGFRAAEAPSSAYRSLARAPVFVVRKTLKAYRLVRF